MKAILITGASRGIGRATAIRAAKEGWSVALNYRADRDAAEATLAAVRDRGVQAVLVPGDVGSETDVIEMFREATTVLGGLTGVVINAGIVAPPQRLVDMDAVRLRRMFEVNVLGAYLTAREAGRKLSPSAGGEGGSIVLVSSAAARLGSPFEYVDYAGSKAALDTLAIGLAKELAEEDVRVNSVRPGLIETEIHASGGQPDRAQPSIPDPMIPRVWLQIDTLRLSVAVLSCNHYLTGWWNDGGGSKGAMVKRISHKDSRCGVARPLDAIGDWWSLLIVRDAFDGLRRFGEFQKDLGLAKNILAARLRSLVAHGIMDTVPAADGSAYQEYVLTEKGRGLFPLLVALRQWGEDYFFEPDEAHALLVDRKGGLPVRKLELRSQDGRVLGLEDAVVRLPPD